MGDSFENTILIGAMFLLVALIFLWASFVRKPRKHRYKQHRSNPAPAKIAPLDESDTTRIRRRRRRTGRPTNPTLAETRGLPPIREDYRVSGDYYQQ